MPLTTLQEIDVVDSEHGSDETKQVSYGLTDSNGNPIWAFPVSQ